MARNKKATKKDDNVNELRKKEATANSMISTYSSIDNGIEVLKKNILKFYGIGNINELDIEGLVVIALKHIDETANMHANASKHLNIALDKKNLTDNRMTEEFKNASSKLSHARPFDVHEFRDLYRDVYPNEEIIYINAEDKRDHEDNDQEYEKDTLLHYVVNHAKKDEIIFRTYHEGYLKYLKDNNISPPKSHDFDLIHRHFYTKNNEKYSGNKGYICLKSRPYESMISTINTSFRLDLLTIILEKCSHVEYEFSESDAHNSERAELKSRTIFLEDKINRSDLHGIYTLPKLIKDIETHQKNDTWNEYHIISLDMDKFKEVNDTAGHDAADYVAKLFVKTAHDTSRDEDTFYHTGKGDEFAALVKMTSFDEVIKLIGRISVRYLEVLRNINKRSIAELMNTKDEEYINSIMSELIPFYNKRMGLFSFSTGIMRLRPIEGPDKKSARMIFANVQKYRDDAKEATQKTGYGTSYLFGDGVTYPIKSEFLNEEFARKIFHRE